MSISSTQERRNRLAEFLVTEGTLRVGALAERFSVSTETIRKDLIELERQGLVKKNHGRAVPASNFREIDRPIEAKSVENADIKNRIAQAAFDMVPEGGVIVLDTGSTVHALSRLLLLKKDLTIFTNSLSCATMLAASNNDVFLLGGKIRKTSMGAIGAWGVNQINSIRADVVFLGSDGFSGTTGPCTVSYEEAEMKKALADCADVKVVLSDSGKFDIPGLFKFCEWTHIDYLITDDRVSSKLLHRIEEQTSVIKVPL